MVSHKHFLSLQSHVRDQKLLQVCNRIFYAIFLLYSVCTYAYLRMSINKDGCMPISMCVYINVHMRVYKSMFMCV